MTWTASSTTTSFTYDGSAVLTETTGSTTKPYTYGNELVRQGSLYPAYDGLGNARRWDSASDTEQSAAYIDGFGNVTSQYGVAQNYQYGAGSGYRSDGDVGLLLVGARYYDPQVGRFISRDTVLTEQPYAYCDGDPVNATDPSGHWVLNITGPCVSISLGFIHLDINVGIAVQGPGLGAKYWGFEGYGSGGFGFGGIGFRASPYLGGAGFGRGNLNDFDNTEVASNATLSFQ